MPALLIVLIWLIVAGVLFSVLWWAINAVGLPAPFLPVAKAVLIILVLIVIFYIFAAILPPLPAVWK